MDKNSEKLTQSILIWTGGIAAGYLFVIKPLLNAIGVNPEDTNTITEQSLLTPAENCWSVQYQPAVDLFNAHPSIQDDRSVLTMAQYYQAIKSMYDDGTATDNVKDIAMFAETIETALAWWHLTTDGEAIIGVFSQLTSQIQVSEIAAYFLYNFNKDLYTSLQGSLFKAGLTPGDLATIIKQVNNLPE